VRTAAQDRAAFRWRTVAEVADDPRLSVSAAQVRKYIAAGELEAIDISSPGSTRPTYRINPESVDRMVRARTKHAA
jgi:hypothetical protein